MNKFLILVTLMFTSLSLSQSLLEKNTSDSLQVQKVFSKLINSLENKDYETLKKISESNIKCDYCDIKSIPIQQVLENQFKDFTNSKIYIAYQNRGFNILLENFKVKGNQINCVWIQTYFPEELGKGYEGKSSGFQFIKINNEFKFYGLTSIP